LLIIRVRLLVCPVAMRPFLPLFFGLSIQEIENI
jgi:hypothetical protein